MLGAGSYMIYFKHIYQKRAFCFKLLQNKLNTDVARLTTQESNLSCNKSRCCRWQKVVAESRVLEVTFAKKSVHVARFTGLRQTCFAASDVRSMYGGTPA